jgi:hypothetical protein
MFRGLAQVQQKTRAPSADWLGYVQDPTWLPHLYDTREDTLVFAHLPREAQRRAVFLDPRFLARAPTSPPIPVQDLPADAIREAARPMHFIFHTGFCCSTLMTRAFDIPGVSMGVKEPSALVYFAELFSTGLRRPGALTACGLTLDLLSRPLESGETQIIKPSNLCNHIIPQILHLQPNANALILYSSLDAFLRAIARRGLEGRTFVRQVFRQFASSIPLEAGYTTDDLLLQTDLQIAAQAWLMQAAFFQSVIKRHGARVRLLNSDTFLADTARVLSQLSGFFGLGLEPEKIAAITSGPVFKEHAKNHGLAFGAADYRAQHDQAGATHFEEINAVRAWARTLAQRCDIPFTLEDNLLT